MGRTQRYLHVLLGFAAITAIGLPACEIGHLVVPCGTNNYHAIDGTFTGDIQEIDGTWILQTVNGAPIPSGGYRLPSAPSKPARFLRSGRLLFRTTSRGWTDNCAEIDHTAGTALAYYQLTEGGKTSDKTYPGRFADERKKKFVTLGAGAYELKSTLAGSPPNTMTAVATIVIFDGFNDDPSDDLSTTFTLVFKR